MARNTYRIGKLTFTSKDAIRRHFGAIRVKYSPGETLNAEDAQEVFALLQGHVDRDQKIGAGIKRLFVDNAPDHPGTCFWIERTVGDPTEFGVPACIDDIGKLNRKSLRECVRDQTEAYRACRVQPGATTFISDFSGIEFPVSEINVDHVEVTFEEIVGQFAARESLSIDKELLTKSKDACSMPTWCDPAVAERFRLFHARFPLQLTSKSENLGEKKRSDNQRIREHAKQTSAS